MTLSGHYGGLRPDCRAAEHASAIRSTPVEVCREATLKQSLFLLLTSTALALVCAESATVQETTGVPGSPSATTTIDGKQLPPPDPKFGGVIEEKASESKPWWPPRIVPPKGAPNVLLIMTDDQGFGARAPSAGSYPLPPWIASQTADCATRISTPHHCAHRRGRR